MSNWDKRFIELASHIAQWSKDPSTKVGSVIVDENKRVISMGFNGFPRGIPDEDLNNREIKYAKVIHSEANTLAFSYTDVSGFTMYCTHIPCSQCASMIIQRGIVRVVCYHPSDDYMKRWKDAVNITRGMFSEANVHLSLM